MGKAKDAKAAAVKESDVEVVEEVKAAAPMKQMVMPVMNESCMRVGDEVMVKDLPFMIMELKGLEVTLKRTDIKK